MILVGNQRGGAKHLANHLLNDHDNDHVEIHAVKGFSTNDVEDALTEIYAISRATRCKQFMFSLSLSPPEHATVTHEDFKNAIEQTATALGLEDQPHVIIFHEKHGRRHCHVVFSRIDTQEMKAINLPFYKERLFDVARELYLTYGWDLPKGFEDLSLSDPLNYSLEEYQLAKRAKRDPREIKAAFQNCWAQSDSKQSFAAALQEKGFYLCRGDRRGFVALDWQGKIYSLSRWTGVKPKDLKERLGDPESYPSVEDMQQQIAKTMSDKHTEFRQKLDADFTRKSTPLENQRKRLVERQRTERRNLFNKQKTAREKQAKDQSTRLRNGLRGLWDWLNGNRKKILQCNAQELEETKRRDEKQLLVLIQQQQVERRALQKKFILLKRAREAIFEDLDAKLETWGMQNKISNLDRNFQERELELRQL